MSATVRLTRSSFGTLLLWAWGVAVLIFLMLPILTIVVYGFNSGRVLVVWEGASFQPFLDAFAQPAMRSAVATSLKAAVASAALATVVGLFAGMYLARRGGRLAAAFVALLALVLVTPEIVNGISLLIWFVRVGGPFGPDWGTDYGLARLAIGHAVFSTAVVSLIVRARLSGVDSSLEEAAADLYAPPVRRFRQITLPLLAPSLLAAFVLSFSLSLDNTIISSFVSVAGSSPWPVFVLSSVRGTLRPEVAAMSTVLLLFTLLALSLVLLTLRRAGRHSDVVQTFAGG